MSARTRAGTLPDDRPATGEGRPGAVVESLEALRSHLQDHAEPHATLRLQGAEGAVDLVLPANAVLLLEDILTHLAKGDEVTVLPRQAELTTQQAADLLNVSRPYLIKLLDGGEIAYRHVGSHRRVLAGSLIEYKRRDDAHRRAVADELSRSTQDMG